jgi:hypothetical protein
LLAKPKDHVVSGEWPTAVIVEVAAKYAQSVAYNLRKAINGRSLREITALTDVNHKAIWSLLHGENWPSLATVARLEWGLGVELWPTALDFLPTLDTDFAEANALLEDQESDGSEQARNGSRAKPER